MELARIVKGIISSIDEKEATAQCILPEYDYRKTPHLHFLLPLTRNDKEYKIPAIDTKVVCLFIGGENQGFILGTYYNEIDKTPDGASKEKIILEYPGGGKIRLDKKTGVLDIEIVTEINISTPSVNIKGNLNVEGSTNIKEDLNVDGNTVTGKDTFTEAKKGRRKL